MAPPSTNATDTHTNEYKRTQPQNDTNSRSREQRISSIVASANVSYCLQIPQRQQRANKCKQHPPPSHDCANTDRQRKYNSPANIAAYDHVASFFTVNPDARHNRVGQHNVSLLNPRRSSPHYSIHVALFPNTRQLYTTVNVDV